MKVKLVVLFSMIISLVKSISLPSQISLLKKYGKQGILGFPISNNIYYGLVPTDYAQLSSSGVGHGKNRKYVYPKSIHKYASAVQQRQKQQQQHQYIDSSSVEFIGPDPFYLDGPGIYMNFGGGDLSGKHAGILDITKDSATEELLSAKYPPY